MIKATYIDHMGSDLSVVNAARVSFGKKSSAVEWGWIDIEDRSGELVAILNEQDTKLIHYLAKHKHFSPFGHAFASFHIKAPIFVARQLVKHKFLRWNEISRRYVDDEPEFYVPEVWRGRSKDKKQGSDGVVNLKKFNQYGDKYQKHYQRLKYTLEDEYDHNLSLYNALLNAGVAPEQARMVLPQSTMTEFYWSGSLDAFASMCVLRLKDDTQYETRLVAQQIDKVMSDLFPVSWKALVHDEA
jgi:thymidylate synthase (FAD)